MIRWHRKAFRGYWRWISKPGPGQGPAAAMDDIPEEQLRHAFPDERTHRYLILDNDASFSPSVAHAIASFGIDPKRTALQSPWQNGTAERFVGSVRRELLDHAA